MLHTFPSVLASMERKGVLVDTKRLYCGSALPSDATPESGDETPTNTPQPETKTCDRVSPNTKRP